MLLHRLCSNSHALQHRRYSLATPWHFPWCSRVKLADWKARQRGCFQDARFTLLFWFDCELQLKWQAWKLPFEDFSRCQTDADCEVNSPVWSQGIAGLNHWWLNSNVLKLNAKRKIDLHKRWKADSSSMHGTEKRKTAFGQRHFDTPAFLRTTATDRVSAYTLTPLASVFSCRKWKADVVNNIAQLLHGRLKPKRKRQRPRGSIWGTLGCLISFKCWP